MNIDKNKKVKTRDLSLEDIQSVLESALFAVGRPLSLKECSELFRIENINHVKIKKALSSLEKKYKHLSCGLELAQTGNTWQIKTKEENKNYIRRLIKGRMFQLSAPALEVLSIVAYKQPCLKSYIDEVRGVESGHLLRTLIEKDLIGFGPRSTAPGKYITYKTKARFLEVFNLKSLKALPSSEDIADLLPDREKTHQAGTKEELQMVLNEFARAGRGAAQEEEQIVKELKSVSDQIKNVRI